ncbi:MAG: hypothetical protein NTY43_10000 [Bacteroidetes bacterium]|nr:hypothetical protein [Bacteroidota bacterium]
MKTKETKVAEDVKSVNEPEAAQTEMVVKKKLDIFNLFYSGAAVVILIGVIAKLLEWPAQDLLITLGLTIEAIVFGVSAVKFVEVQVKREVASEETLAKLAEGISAISSTMAAGDDNSSTYVNIQTGLVGADIAAMVPADSVIISGSNATGISSSTVTGTAPFNLADYRTDKKVEDVKVSIGTPMVQHDNRVDSSNVTIEINPQMSGNMATVSSQQMGTAIGSNAAPHFSELEKLAIVSLTKDQYFHTDWIKFNENEYSSLSNELPALSMSDLALKNPTELSENELDLLFTAMVTIKFTNLFDYFIVEPYQSKYLIRNKEANEIVVFGGEEAAILTHCNKYFSNSVRVSPAMASLKSSVKYKNRNLIEYLIENADVKSEEEFASLATILVGCEDEVKAKLFNKFKKVRFNIETNAGYMHTKHLILLSLSFKDQQLGKKLFQQLFEVQVDENSVVLIDDLVNYNSNAIHFGPNNEYKVELNEVLVNGELKNFKSVDAMLDKLTVEASIEKHKLLDIFNLKEQNSKSDIFNKLNIHLEKTNTQPTGSQLAFILLYKQYN